MIATSYNNKGLTDTLIITLAQSDVVIKHLNAREILLRLNGRIRLLGTIFSKYQN